MEQKLNHRYILYVVGYPWGMYISSCNNIHLWQYMLKLVCSTMLFTAEWWQNRGSRVINYDDFEDHRIEITIRIISYGSSCHLVSLHWILIITVGVLQMLLQKYIYFNIFEILNKWLWIIFIGIWLTYHCLKQWDVARQQHHLYQS